MYIIGHETDHQDPNEHIDKENSQGSYQRELFIYSNTDNWKLHKHPLDVMCNWNSTNGKANI